MTTNDSSKVNFILNLEDRNKEYDCLFKIEEILNKSSLEYKEAFKLIIGMLPQGMQYPNLTQVKIIFNSEEFSSNGFTETPWYLSSKIVIDDEVLGEIFVYYKKELKKAEIGPFLKQEEKLIRNIASRLGHFILNKRLRDVFNEVSPQIERKKKNVKPEWRIILEMLRKTDPNLFMKILRKLLHHLLWNGVDGAARLMQLSSIDRKVGDSSHKSKKEDDNKPTRKRIINNYDEYIFAILKLAEENIPDDQILSRLMKWIQDDKASGLVKAVESLDTSLSEISDAIRKYYHLAPEKFELDMATIKGLRVSLIRRFFTDQLYYISIAKEYVMLTDFYHLIHKMIFSFSSHGKLGGKSAGLFLASHILRKCEDDSDLIKNVKTPKTWFIASDGIMHFMHYNDMEEILEQKHKDIDEVRVEYPHIVQIFKNSQFPPDMVRGMSQALDDFGDNPLVVRSSSLMEDQLGQAFSGKYKSLFLANQGTKEERLVALMDAVAEVYASTFGPDPIEYRTERGLIDFHEEMGIMIQQVVGKKVGKYYLPAFAGVAFSNNEFRWSPRIKREDGLVRIVPGLGTRAVDRLSDDYPILIAPGQPNLRVNITLEEIVKYSPKKLDVINLETNEFETIPFENILTECGDQYPAVESVFSVLDDSIFRQPNFNTNYKEDHLVCNFEGLFSKTNFIKRVREILITLEEKIQSPVDIEFAHDGKDFYLLQCRPQSYFSEIKSDPIPKNIPEERIIFTADKYISNGKVPNITFIVYVDPEEYGKLETLEEMKNVGIAVGKINKMLPKRQFILMGPGRWGSRGDIKLGVSVTYSDINNTAMLIEIARKKGNYVPDLSFGTHFFQDLVESGIQYLPLYPDDEGIFFNERFFELSENLLKTYLPEFENLEKVIKVIDVKKSSGGNVLKVLLNADLDEGMGIIVNPNSNNYSADLNTSTTDSVISSSNNQWKWRQTMAERIAASINPAEFGIKAVYLFGSTKDATADTESDIDLIVHITNDPAKKRDFQYWIEGWSLCLSEMNYLKTGHKSETGLLDVKFITDEDFEKKTEFAEKINLVSDEARKLKLKNELT